MQTEVIGQVAYEVGAERSTRHPSNVPRAFPRWRNELSDLTKPHFGVHHTVENRLTILVLADLEIWCVVSRLDEIALVVDLGQPRGFIAHLTAHNTRYGKACFTCVK